MGAAGNPPQEAVGRLSQVDIDVSDLERGARFWSAVLGLEIRREFGQYLEFVRHEGSPAIILQKVPEPKTAKTRVHLDIEVDDLDVALAKVEALGGKKLQEIQEYDERFVVVADPDGNEFCLVTEDGPQV